MAVTNGNLAAVSDPGDLCGVGKIGPRVVDWVNMSGLGKMPQRRQERRLPESFGPMRTVRGLSGTDTLRKQRKNLMVTADSIEPGTPGHPTGIGKPDGFTYPVAAMVARLCGPVKVSGRQPGNGRHDHPKQRIKST